jgi:hypothetical protein
VNQTGPSLEPLSCMLDAEECLHLAGRKVGSHWPRSPWAVIKWYYGSDAGAGGVVYAFGGSSDAESWLTKLSGPERIIDWSF